jgi:hypothetical protein
MAPSRFPHGLQANHCRAIDAYGSYSHLAKPDRIGGMPLKLAFCWAHGRRKLISAKPKKGSPPWESLPLHVKRKPL